MCRPGGRAACILAAMLLGASAVPGAGQSGSRAVAEDVNHEPVVGAARFDARFRHDTATVNGVRLHFVHGGRGEAVVLLHGWPYTWYDWHRVMGPLADRFHVIAPDLRGMGDSDKPESGYAKTEVARDIHALVRRLGFQRAHVVGHDIGGMVALAYALQFPAATGKVVLSEHFIPGFGLEERTHMERGNVWHFAFHGSRPLADSLVLPRARWYVGHWLDHGLADRARLPGTARETFLRAYESPDAVRGGFAHYAALPGDGQANRRLIAERGRLRMPVLVVEGSAGLRGALCRDAPRVAADLRCHTVPDAGHSVQAEQPDVLAGLLAGFLGAR